MKVKLELQHYNVAGIDDRKTVTDSLVLNVEIPDVDYVKLKSMIRKDEEFLIEILK